MRGLVLSVLLIASALTAPATAVAEPAQAAGTAAVNCAGWPLISAQHVRLTNGSGTSVGSIQLCRKPHYTGGWEYFSRLEMYDPLPAGRLASGYIYYTRLGSGPDYLSCDSHVGAIKPGGTLCYSTDVLNDELIVDLRATGRAWYWNGTDWVLYAQGTTAWFD